MKTKLEPPAFRFIRCYDVTQNRMVNVWQRLYTQEQIENSPMAIELTVQAKTIEKCMEEIRNWKDRWITEEIINEIEKASKQLLDAKPSFYGVIKATP